MNPKIIPAVAAAVLVAVGALLLFLLMRAPEPAQIAAPAIAAPVIEAPAAVKLPETAPPKPGDD